MMDKTGILGSLLGRWKASVLIRLIDKMYELMIDTLQVITRCSYEVIR